MQYDSKCPACGHAASGRCRCPLNHMNCPSGHQWMDCPFHGPSKPVAPKPGQHPVCARCLSDASLGVYSLVRCENHGLSYTVDGKTPVCATCVGNAPPAPVPEEASADERDPYLSKDELKGEV